MLRQGTARGSNLFLTNSRLGRPFDLSPEKQKAPGVHDPPGAHSTTLRRSLDTLGTSAQGKAQGALRLLKCVRGLQLPLPCSYKPLNHRHNAGAKLRHLARAVNCESRWAIGNLGNPDSLPDNLKERDVHRASASPWSISFLKESGGRGGRSLVRADEATPGLEH
jgi:hypothetical protein